MDSDKTQTKVKELKVGDEVVTLSGDKWKIIAFEECTRSGGLERDGDFYSVSMKGPNSKIMKNIWHREAKVLISKK
jgi:preprotein translocase subunit YajC